MKHAKLFLIIVVFLSVGYWGCSDSTGPIEDNKEEVIAAMDELDEMMGIVSATDAFNAFSEMPNVSLGSAELNIELPGNLKEALRKSSSITETNPMLFFTYLFFPRGTYTYDGNHWSYNNLPDDEIVFIFPYVDQNTGASHIGTLRYYGIEKSATLMSVTVDLIVDGTKVAEVTLQVTGSGFTNIIITQNPVITTMTVQGYVVDDSGTQYNFSFSVSETQITITLGVNNQIPITITMTGDLFNESGNGPETLTAAYSSLEIHITDLNADSGEVGYITFNGVQVAIIVVIDDVPYVQWNDGTRVPLDSYFTNSSVMGGEFI